GQTIVLEDYLEVHPERRGILKKYITEGRIHVGPWYILPDEFLVSAESIVRNLLLGHKIASEFGRIMKVGYIPDPFGHISQLPQILRGFVIDNIIFWRGIEYNQTQGNEFIWQGPDGTELFALHLPKAGYCNAMSLPEDVDQAYKLIKEAIDDLLSRETSKSLLLLNGVDHLEAQPHIPRYYSVSLHFHLLKICNYLTVNKSWATISATYPDRPLGILIPPAHKTTLLFILSGSIT
ncbi:unnamed protein product, partial [marine sediment metagenome]